MNAWFVLFLCYMLVGWAVCTCVVSGLHVAGGGMWLILFVFRPTTAAVATATV